MVLSNATKRARYISSITNQNQGGGSKKAGFPYQVGRSMWTDVAFQSSSLVNGKCCKLSNMQRVIFPLARISRPIGRDNAGGYWNIPGTGSH